MRKTILAAVAAVAACQANAQFFEDLAQPKPKQKFGEITFTGGNLAASRKTGEMTATGNITAKSGPYRFFTERLTRDVVGTYDFGEDAMVTTCSNDLDHLHWKVTGQFVYETEKAITAKNAWLYFEDIPVLWLPWMYYPLNTNYGLRFMPGYTSRWGCYFLSGYIYDIYNEFGDSLLGLGGSSYLNWRQKNGIEVGQTVRWRLGDFGKGKIKGFYAWDNDYDRYTRHWNDSHHYNYKNWGSDVDRERYRVILEHRSDFTERDALNVKAQYISDSHYLRDFARRQNRYESIPANEAWYEHRENLWAAGASVSGPINDFYGGVARLPEAWFAIEPQPIFDLPANYESQTRAGYLNRQFAKYGSTDPMYRYAPYIGLNGRGADYQTFRADSNHRVSLPFMLSDMFAFVPRAGYRATWWSDSGDPDKDYLCASGDPMYRGIAEVGVTASTRAYAWINDDFQHVFEPYIDYSFQDVSYGTGKKNRNYIFDNYDGSVDWLDQFGFEGRGLPYNWHGVRPGIRNYLRRRDENGSTRSLLDTDIYAAVPFEDASYIKRGTYAGYPKNAEDGFYNRHDCVVPGIMLRFRPSNRFMFSSRAEYDIDGEKVAYADLNMEHRVTQDFSWNLGYIGRDHRIWDYLPSEYDRWNYQYSNIIRAGFRHHVCDWFEWSPYIRWDARCNELDETGVWFDFLTDCLGFRFSVDYENGVKRVDGSKQDSDLEFGFAIYLRALGASSMLDLAKF